MKKMIFAAMLMTIAISANAMTYNEARQEALFLSDKMAYELDLTEEQYEAIYEINLDYLMSINSRGDAYGSWWNVRNRDLEIVLSPTQYRLYVSRAYFYRPLTWTGGAWSFGIYGRYHRGHFYRHHPTVYVSYRGGHRIGHRSYYHGRNYYPQPRHGHGPQPSCANDAVQNAHMAATTAHTVAITAHMVATTVHMAAITAHTVAITVHTVATTAHTVAITAHTAAITAHTATLHVIKKLPYSTIYTSCDA